MLKCKTRDNKLYNAKSQKSIIVDAIDALGKWLILETRNADHKHDISCVAKAAALCTGKKQKEKQLEEYSAKISQLDFHTTIIQFNIFNFV